MRAKGGTVESNIPLRGTAHCHSNHSFDGHLSYAELREFFLSKGMSFSCMTEHIEYLDQSKVDAFFRACAEHSDDRFLFIPGLEMDYFKVYFLGLSPLHVDFTSHQTQFDSVHPKAAMRVFAHPIKAKYRYPQWLVERCDGVELLNTRHDGRHYFRPQCEQLLADVRQHRPAAVGLAGMDFHSRRDYSGVHIVLDEGVPLQQRAVIDALKEGRFVIEMNGERLADFPAWRRSMARARIHAMDAALGINKQLAQRGLRLPSSVRRLLRRGIAGT